MTRRKTVGLIASLALTAALAGGVVWAARSGGESAVGLPETPTPTATPTVTAVPTAEPGTPTTLTPTPSESPSSSATPTPTATLTPSPAALPPPDEGYVWFVTPDDWSLQFSVQIPKGWVSAGDTTFVPEGTESNFPYPILPQLTFIVAPRTQDPPDSESGWKHPFVWSVGEQGGGGCTGDVSGYSEASPSGSLTAGSYTWDLYHFTCSYANLNYPPGVTYTGIAGERSTNGLILDVLALDPPGSDAAGQAFKTAAESFVLR